jgi:hypothetical protein
MCLPALLFAVLALLALGPPLMAQGDPPEPDERVTTAGTPLPVVLEGFVFEPDGTPAQGAVVASSAGGRAVADADGWYRLQIRVPLAAESVQITAVGSGTEQVVSARIELSKPPGSARVDPLRFAPGGQCSSVWSPTFGGDPPGTEGPAYSLAVFDDGGGPALYAGGIFEIAQGQFVNGIAKWDGSRWSALGTGFRRDDIPDVRALAVYDDGSGPALYAAVIYHEDIGEVARWNGSSWTSIGELVEPWALTVYDDGNGPVLVVGGQFFSVGGVAARNIASWDGTSWAPLGGGTNNLVNALTAHDDGGGPALYAGGLFTSAGGQAAKGIARWNGSIWSALGSGLSNLPSSSGWVRALCTHDDGHGSALIAAGIFTVAGGVPAANVAKWDGSSWSALGGGVDDDVCALAVYDDGGGPGLYVGGSFDRAGAVAAQDLAKWDGSSWSAVASGSTTIDALAVHDDGGGARLFAGGYSFTTGGRPARGVARLDGSSWSVLGEGGVSDRVWALKVFDEGAGPVLHVGGDFAWVGDVSANGIASWNGSSWSPLGIGMQNVGEEPSVRALEVYDDGGGPALHAGGRFVSAGGAMASNVAKWDGSSWSALGSGIVGYVSALRAFDDGGGPALFASGSFQSAGGVAAFNIARWNGSSWAPVGGIGGPVEALELFDDGGGPALYAGGGFSYAGSTRASSIAKWNGSSWSALQGGVFGAIQDLAVFDDGSGPALYAAGSFTSAGGVPAVHVAKWDGSSWSALGSGVGVGFELAWAMTSFDDGSGPGLFVGGWFTIAGGMAANGIARWDGSSWTPLGSGMPGLVAALAVFDGVDRGGPDLIAGGRFPAAPDSNDSYLARWTGCLDRAPPVLDCPKSISVPDSGAPGETVTFTITASDDRDPSPAIICEPPSGSLFPAGITIVQCKATDRARNQSSCSFPVNVIRKKGQ